MAPVGIPRRPFGRHAQQVPALGFGGFHPGKVATIAEAVRIVDAAVDAGRFELYKTTAEHEGDEGREQHGFLSSDTLGG